MSSRPVAKVVVSKEQGEGQGARVHRTIGTSELRTCDPFLMFDEGNVALPAGFPDHPHRGFEAVSYILSGSIKHEDFAGHAGELQEGDLQWMTAGRGIVHSEMPTPKAHALQLWVNLAKVNKMMEPRYQELKKSQIPVAEKDGVKVSIISGTSMGIESPVRTLTPTTFLDFKLSPKAKFSQPIPATYTCLAYTMTGSTTFGPKGQSKTADAHTMVVFGDGNCIEFQNDSTSETRFFLICGQPLNEPTVQYGPFVMNTREEIDMALRDYQLGQNGFERAKTWRS